MLTRVALHVRADLYAAIARMSSQQIAVAVSDEHRTGFSLHILHKESE